MPGDRRDADARRDAGGEHDLVEAARARSAADARVPSCSRTPMQLDAAAEVAQRLVELLLARDALGHVELAADLGCRSNSVTSWPRSASVVGAREPGGARADHRDALAASLRGRISSSVSWQARGFTRQVARLRCEDVVEAGLVAGDAGVDLVGAPCARLVHELGIGQQRARHRDHVGAALGEMRSATSGMLMRLVATSGMRHLALQLRR